MRDRKKSLDNKSKDFDIAAIAKQDLIHMQKGVSDTLEVYSHQNEQGLADHADWQGEIRQGQPRSLAGACLD